VSGLRDHSTSCRGGGYGFGPPKTQAGRRAVAFSATLTLDLTRHLARFTAPDNNALVFTSPTGRPLRRGNFRHRVWVKGAEFAGIPDWAGTSHRRRDLDHGGPCHDPGLQWPALSIRRVLRSCCPPGHVAADLAECCLSLRISKQS
jgi:hypothetical protein